MSIVIAVDAEEPRESDEEARGDVSSTPPGGAAV